MKKIVNSPYYILPPIQNIGRLGYWYGLVGEDLSNNLNNNNKKYDYSDNGN